MIHNIVGVCLLLVLISIPLFGMGSRYKMKGIYGFVDKLRRGRFGIYAKYPNVTNQFYEEYLPQQAEYIDGCFTLMCIAQKRFGKTIFNMGVIDILMRHPARKLCIWDTPELAQMIQESAWFGDRVYTTDRLHEVDNYSIIYIDEGLTKFNGKRALTKLSRKFGEALTYTSHKSIIIIASAQTTGMIKDLRDKCEIVVYGRLPRPFLSSASGDRFLQKEFNTLIKLPKEKMFILSSAFGFIPEHEHNSQYEKLRKAFDLKKNDSSGIGVITGDKRKRCTWFTDEISHNMSGESLDTDLENSLRETALLDKSLDIIFDVFEMEDLQKSYTKRTIKGYFLRNHPEIYQFLHDGSLWTKLIELMAYEILIINQEKKQAIMEAEDQMVEQQIEIKEGLGFPEYCRNYIHGNTKDGLTAEVICQMLNGVSMHQIADNLNISSSTVNNRVKNFRHDDMGFRFEEWFAQKMGGNPSDVGGSVAGKPDFIDKDGNIYSLKAYYHNQGSVTFYQTKDFNPEYKLAKKQKKHYTIVYLNPVWKLDGAVMVDVDPDGDEKIVISRPNKRKKISYPIFSIKSYSENMNDDESEKILNEFDELEKELKIPEPESTWENLRKKRMVEKEIG